MVDERVAVDVLDQPVGLPLYVERDGVVIAVGPVHDGVVSAISSALRGPGSAVTTYGNASAVDTTHDPST